MNFESGCTTILFCRGFLSMSLPTRLSAQCGNYVIMHERVSFIFDPSPYPEGTWKLQTANLRDRISDHRNVKLHFYQITSTNSIEYTVIGAQNIRYTIVQAHETFNVIKYVYYASRISFLISGCRWKIERMWYYIIIVRDECCRLLSYYYWVGDVGLIEIE